MMLEKETGLCKKILAQGKVQGVGYRDFVQRYAKKLGLFGSVRNLRNGDVLIIVQGQPDQIQALIRYCSQGPHYSSVDDLVISTIGKQNFTSFQILSTIDA